jgi:dienelactone hydrolase
MKTEFFDYSTDGVTSEGYLAYADDSGPKPGVLICHAWAGQSDFERGKAEQLAELGYVGFAADLFGKGVRGSSMEENAKLIKPFVEDRRMLRQRLLGALDTLKGLPIVDSGCVAAIGFCFGGLCVLDLARSAPPDLRGVVSFHGLLHPPNLEPQREISAKVLILHGYDDPMATPEHVLAVAKELSAANADWQLHAYGGTSHAFTNPNANSPDHGLLYNAVADRRSWATMKNFLAEALG